MFTTSLAVFALSTVTSLGASSLPAWHTDYRMAIEHAHLLHKPIAVFIAKSPATVLQAIPTVAQRVLQSDYIALMVTTDTEAGQRLAERFELTEGLVISDSTGGFQAFRTSGLAPVELASTLERFGDPKRAVRTTEHNLASASPALLPVSNVPAQFVAPEPVYAPPPVSAPAAIFVPPAQAFAPAAHWQPAPMVVPTIMAAPAAVCRT